MKNVIPYACFLLLAAFPAAVHGQSSPNRVVGSKVIKTESRDPGAFDQLKVSSGINVRVQLAETADLVVEAEDNVLSHVLTVVNGNTLEIKLTPGVAFPDLKPVTVSVRCKTLSGLAASAGSSISVEGTLSGSRLKCQMQGGSTLKSTVAFQDLVLELKGESFVYLAGTAGTATIDVSGGSVLKAKELAIQSITLTATGASSAVIQPVKDLAVTASGKSIVRYAGHPEIREKKVMQMAKVKGR